MRIRRERSADPSDPFEVPDSQRLKLFLYLMPVVGFIPALWTLYYHSGDRQEQQLSRTVVILTLGWLVAYVFLATGANVVEDWSLPLLLGSSVLTSGYFLTNFWLIVRVWQRKSTQLPFVSGIGDRLP